MKNTRNSAINYSRKLVDILPFMTTKIIKLYREELHSFGMVHIFHLFHKYKLSTYYVPSTGNEDA